MTHYLKIFLLIAIFNFTILPSEAKLKFPRQLDGEAQKKIVQTLGFGFVASPNTHLIPLGGFDGAELALNYQSVATQKISELGTTSDPVGTTLIPQLALSKGLYEDIDMGISFTPGLQDEDVQIFNLHGRWSFPPSQSLPYLLGVNLYASGSQWQNLFHTRTVGLDLFAVYYFNKFSLNAGYGRARCIAKFIGGTNGITQSGQTEHVDILENRFFAGGAYQMGKFILALQAFRFEEVTYNFNLGYRF